MCLCRGHIKWMVVCLVLLGVHIGNRRTQRNKISGEK